MLPFHWLTQTIALGLGIAFSPINIALVALLLLGRQPLLRCATYLSGWMLANGGALCAVVLVGGRFSWAMHLGTRGQVLMDLIGAGALSPGLPQLGVAPGRATHAMPLPTAASHPQGPLQAAHPGDGPEPLDQHKVFHQR